MRRTMARMRMMLETHRPEQGALQSKVYRDSALYKLVLLRRFAANSGSTLGPTIHVTIKERTCPDAHA